MEVEFKDGTKLEGELVTQALCVQIIRNEGNHFYLVSKFTQKNAEDPTEDDD